MEQVSFLHHYPTIIRASKNSSHLPPSAHLISPFPPSITTIARIQLLAWALTQVEDFFFCFNNLQSGVPHSSISAKVQSPTPSFSLSTTIAPWCTAKTVHKPTMYRR